MDIANVMVALGGDRGYTVPKYSITPSEIAVLIAIHGEGSVFDIQPVGEEDRSSRAEIEHLYEVYGKAQDGDGNGVVRTLFPGAGARAIETLAEMNLPEDLYKAEVRAKPAAKAAPAKAKAGKAAAPAPDIFKEPDDGIGDMPASVMG